MYQLIGDQVYDSNEIREEIEQKTSFVVLEDMTARTKREDALAFKVSIAAEQLREGLPRYIEEETLMDELMTLADTKIRSELLQVSPQDETAWASYAYTYDEVEHAIILVIGMMGRENAGRKLPDVMKRLLTQV